MDPIVLLSFVGTAILLTLMPGPDILFVMAQSISQNKWAGIATALGLCTGLLVHTTAAAVGISALVYQSATAFAIVKYAGAAYLLYLAWQAFREKEGGLTLQAQDRKAYQGLYKKGIFMNILNPKVSLFFLALFPQFVKQSAGGVPIQMMILGLIFMLQALVVFTLVSIFSEMASRALQQYTGIEKRMSMIKGVLFTFIGLKLALGDR